MIELKRFEYKGELTSDNFNEKVIEYERYLNSLSDSISKVANDMQDSITSVINDLSLFKNSNDMNDNIVNEKFESIDNMILQILSRLGENKTYVDNELSKRYLNTQVYTKSETDEKIKEVLGVAPNTLDTLQEIANALGNDSNFAVTITNKLSEKVDKVSGKDLSTNDYTNTEKQKLANIQDSANNYVHPNTHSADMIVENSNRRFVSDDEKARWDNINSKANANHTHTKANITDFAHSHDDRYYTESEVNNLLNTKANANHTHTKANITDFAHSHDDRYYTENEINSIKSEIYKKLDFLYNKQITILPKSAVR